MSATATEIRHDWTLADIRRIYAQPFPDLIFQAQTIHRENFDPNQVQRSTLLSIKTGGCPENCSYCPQSAHYDTGIEKHAVLPKDYVLKKAAEAKAEGSTRFCMGAAWREVKDGKDFDAVLDLVSGVHNLGMEVCCTLGMLSDSQARRLKEAGCYAYNHNLDTSPEFYGKIISTRTYQDRLDTLARVRKAGITVCCGGIIGMGESLSDRFGLLMQLANQNPHPESVPINALQRVEGTPLADQKSIDPIEFIRTVATARILMPRAYVRLSAGRVEMSDEAQALCFLAGANSIFAGDKLLTQKNNGENRDQALMQKLGMHFLETTEHANHADACSEEMPALCQSRRVSEAASVTDVFRWNPWNEEHIGQHGILPEEAEYLVNNVARPYPENIGHGKWLVRGQSPNGRFIQVIFVIEDDCYYVIHARGLTDKEKRQLRRRRR